jgi:hypothetical protein
MRIKALALAAAWLAVVVSVAEAAPRAVVELFTTPFCSSCPRADALFVELARDPDLITLVMPIDTYNRPGRADELAKREFTERQGAYADTRRNQNLRMTPQAIINGTAPAIGFDRRGIAKAVARTADALSVPVSVTEADGELLVSVGSGKAPKAGAVVTVLPYFASREASMHGGRSIEYANLVGDLVPLGTWTGAPLERRLSVDGYAQYDGVVVLLQAGTRNRPGAILGAARLANPKGPKA